MVNFRRLRSLTSSTDKHNSHVVDKSQNNEVSNQQLSGIVETSNIAPRVEEQKDKYSNEWPNAVEVWKASRTKSNGTWSVLNGEEIMNKLQEEGEKNKEKILAAPLPLVEHFSLVLKRKSSYARGLGLKGITSKAQENILLQAEIEGSKKREKNLEEEVAKFKEIAQAALDKQATEIKQIFAHLASNQGLQNMLSNASPSTTSSED
nr:Transposase, Ptta/En/Spm, plant [Ipomoea batatas]